MIRRAEEKDLSRINDLLHQVHDVHSAVRPDIFRRGNKKYTDDEILEIISNDSTPVFVSTDENDIVTGYAFCIYQVVKGEASLMDRKTLYIDDLCVDAELRGQHIGTKLYEFVLEEAGRNNCDNITLNVWCLNGPAMKFYEKCGMEPLKVVMEKIL